MLGGGAAENVPVPSEIRRTTAIVSRSWTACFSFQVYSFSKRSCLPMPSQLVFYEWMNDHPRFIVLVKNSLESFFRIVSLLRPSLLVCLHTMRPSQPPPCSTRRASSVLGHQPVRRLHASPLLVKVVRFRVYCDTRPDPDLLGCTGEHPCRTTCLTWALST